MSIWLRARVVADNLNMTLTLQERAERGQLCGRALSFREVAHLFADEADRIGPIADRLQRACKGGEIAAEAVTKEIRRQELQQVQSKWYGMNWEPVEVVTLEVIDYLISPDAVQYMPDRLADDLPIIEECPALVAWLGIKQAEAGEVVAKSKPGQRKKGGPDARTRFIQDEIELGKPETPAQAVQCVTSAIVRDIEGKGLVFFDRASPTEYIFRFEDGTVGKVSASSIARSARRYFKQIGERMQRQQRQRA